MINLKGIEPVGKRVLVEVVLKEPEVQSTLIYLEANEKPQLTDRCNVLRIGKEVTLVEEGKKYIYAVGRGTKLTYKDVEYLLLEENDFRAKVDE